MVGVDCLSEGRQQPVHALARQRAHLQHDRVSGEVELATDLPGESRTIIGVEQLPLVEEHHDRATSGVDALCEPLVLRGDALRGVDHEQRHIGAVDGLERPHERVVLGAVTDA